MDVKVKNKVRKWLVSPKKIIKGKCHANQKTSIEVLKDLINGSDVADKRIIKNSGSIIVVEWMRQDVVEIQDYPCNKKGNKSSLV